MKKSNNMLFILLISIGIILVLLISYNVYKAYSNTKEVTLLSEYIIDNTKDSLAKEDGIYLFKGDTTNNYVLYNNMIWRILQINSDGSIKLVLDDYINMLPIDKIDSFLEKVENNLDLTYLTKNYICKDKFDNENNITCNTLEKDRYVSLLSVYDYIKSFDDGNTFITSDNEIMWLYNDNVHTNGDKISTSSENNYYEIKPVVTIRNSVLYMDGDGSLNKPYMLGNKEFSIGSKVKIDNDTYIVYDCIDGISLMSEVTIDNIYKENASKYLSNEYIDKLSYKDIINKIELPSLEDIKFDSNINDYYLSDNVNGFDLVYNNPIIYGDKDTLHKIRYVIKLDKKKVNNFVKENDIYVYKEGGK